MLGVPSFTNNVPEENPPFSRIFVSCSPNLTKDFLLERFEIYGNVQSIRMITDKANGVFKGCCFIKYERASSAAAAVENMNELLVDSNTPALKVTYADPRGARRNFFDDGEVPPRSRLFITFLKGLTEEDIRDRLSEYGNVEYVKILKDKETMQPRGIGFVKYSKASEAFLALESLTDCRNPHNNAGQTLRVKLANPRPQMLKVYSSQVDKSGVPTTQSQPYLNQQPVLGSNHLSGLRMWKNPLLPASQRIDNNSPPGSRVFFSFSKQLPLESLQQLFSSHGPLESIYLIKGKNCGYAKYSSAEAASSASNAMNGVELLTGILAKVVVASPQIQGISSSTQKALQDEDTRMPSLPMSRHM